MRPFRKALAVVLAVLWLPVTAHCALEAVGLLVPHVEEDGMGCGRDESHEECGTCSIVEGGQYRVFAATIKAPVPPLLACDRLLSLRLVDFLTELCVAAEYNSPRDTRGWIPDWNFSRRVAGMPRAPSLNA